MAAILVGGEKGGTGKSTVAIQGDRILIPCNDVDRRLESDLITGS